MDILENIKNLVVAFLVTKGFELLGAAIFLVLGAIAANRLGRILGELLTSKKVEPPVRSLVVRAMKVLVFGMAALLALDKLEVPITSLVAGIGVAGVGLGLAMQGVLGNLVAGLTIIFTRQFRVGEYIELLGVSGQVMDIELLSTKLRHADRSIVSIPNRKIIGEILHNFGTIRQLDLSVGVAYNTDVNLALATLREILARNPRVLKEPPAVVGLTELADFSINLCARPWTNVADYGLAQMELYRAILEEFRAEKIEIPFPQREVRWLGQGPGA